MTNGQVKASAFQLWRAREKRLKDLQALEWRPVDYAALLTPREYVVPPEPSYDHLVQDAKTKIEVKYFFHYLVDGGVIALFVALAVATLDSLFAPVFLLGSVAGLAVLVSDHLDKKKTLAASLRNASVVAARQLESFRRRVEEARAEFEQDERNRLWQVRRLADGNRDAVMSEAAAVAEGVTLPFPVAVTVEIYDTVPLISLQFPADDFIPRARLNEDGGEFPKMTAEVRRQYSYTIAGVALNIALAIIARIPAWGEVCVNAYGPAGEGPVCLFAARVKRSQAEQAPFYETAPQFAKSLGAVCELQPDGSLTVHTPVVPAWHATVLSREVQKIQAACKVERD